MTRPLRQRHRRIIAVIGVLLPIAFAAGIAARKPVPSLASLPSGLAASREKFTATIWERHHLFMKLPVRIQLLREARETGQHAISFTAPKDFARPDLIVYWIAAGFAIDDSLPDDARLLGSFGATALPLPNAISNVEGVLVLYSLADNEILDVSKPLRFDGSIR
jgi:hypothetical protein